MDRGAGGQVSLDHKHYTLKHTNGFWMSNCLLKNGSQSFSTIKTMIMTMMNTPQDNQDGNLRRGSLHLQTQREGQEGQVVHQEPGKVQEKKKHFCFAKNHIP